MRIGETRYRGNYETPESSPKKALGKRRLREAYETILANSRMRRRTPVREVGARACRTLRRAGLVHWAHPGHGHVEVL